MVDDGRADQGPMLGGAPAGGVTAASGSESGSDDRRDPDAPPDPASLLRTILDNTAVGYVLVDEDGRIRWASPSLHDLLGYVPEEWVGTHVLDFVHPDDIEATAPSLARIVAGSTSAEPLVVRGRHAAGGWRWLEALTKVTGIEGAGALFSLHDVTDRVQAEQALRESERRMAALLEASKDMTILVDGSGTLLWVSGNAPGITGYTTDELLGRNAFNLLDDESLDDAMERFAGVLAGDRPTPMTLGIRRRDSSVLPVEGLGTVLEPGPDPADVRILVNVRDIAGRLATERALRESESRFRTVMQNSYDVVVIVDDAATITWVTPNSVRLLGWTPDEVLGRNGLELVHPDDVPEMVRELGEFTSGIGVPNPTTVKLLHKDGSWHHVELVGTDLLDNPDVRGIALSLRGVDERVAAEQARLRLLDVFELSGDFVGIVDREGDVIYLNRAARDLYGLDPDEPTDRAALRTRFLESSIRRLEGEVIPALRETGTWKGELELEAADGSFVPVLGQLVVHHDADGEIAFVSGVYRDISERKAFERHLEHRATHDALTGLPNRTLLLDRLEVALARAARRGTDVAVLFCDLDHFKAVNDGLGHAAGDELLAAAAHRLADQLRPGDTVSRYGGDEFVILCEDLEHLDDAVVIADRVDRALAQPFELDGDEVHLGVSVGIAIATAGVGEPEALIRDADAAMYRAKAQGRGRHQVFRPDMWDPPSA